MNKAIVLKQKDIKEILSDYFNIDVAQIVPSKYSYIVVGLDEEIINNMERRERYEHTG